MRIQYGYPGCDHLERCESSENLWTRQVEEHGGDWLRSPVACASRRCPHAGEIRWPGFDRGPALRAPVARDCTKVQQLARAGVWAPLSPNAIA